MRADPTFEDQTRFDSIAEMMPLEKLSLFLSKHATPGPGGG